jgi:6-pyruvoyltetrahydropterin/6-carboxytetrahydropterin synthase
MYSITKEFTFDSAHYLRNYAGKCANMHGHTYRVIVTIEGDRLDPLGMLVDFSTVKGLVTHPFDHLLLNEVEPFTEINPTAEHMASTIFYIIDNYCSTLDNDPICKSVLIWETPTSSAKYERKSE